MADGKIDDGNEGWLRPIYRRDFLQGVSLGIGSLALLGCQAQWACGFTPAAPSPELSAQGSPQGLDPTNFQGQNDDAKNLGHFVRSQQHLQMPRVAPTEHYDLVVVGGGIAGLTAALTFQEERKGQARILVLDSNSELGGHARRNTFIYKGQQYISPGGTYALEYAEESPAEVMSLFGRIGLDLQRMLSYRDDSFGKTFSLDSAVLCDPKALGNKNLQWLKGFHTRPYGEVFAKSSLPLPLQRDLLTLYTTRQNYLPKLAGEHLQAYLQKISWQDFVLKHMRLSPGVLPFINLYATDLCGLGCDAVSAAQGYDTGPGFAGMGGTGFVEEGGMLKYAYQPKHRFPDGNHTLARLILKKLKPEALSLEPGMDSVFNAEMLPHNFDNEAQAVRIRLNTMATRIEHVHASKKVAVEFVQTLPACSAAPAPLAPKPGSVTADHVIMSGWGMVAKHIVPELADVQKQALQEYAYTSALYINVLLKHWRPFAKLGAQHLFLPGGFCTWMSLADPLHVGSYRPAYHPDQPIVLSLYKYLYSPGQNPLAQMRQARFDLEKTSFEEIEREVRTELDRTLGPWGFDSKEQIVGIIVNRWAHGYNFFKGPDGPHTAYQEGKKRLGRISFAGADSGGDAWSQQAMQEAIRAVHEQLG